VNQIKKEEMGWIFGKNGREEIVYKGFCDHLKKETTCKK
jgi:hypothetical protein